MIYDVYSTHQQTLIKGLMATKGPVLELGCGWYSTPIIHEICKVQGRMIFSMDDRQDWLKQFANLDCWFHLFVLGLDFSKQLPEHYGLIFVDNGGRQRNELLKYADKADIVIVHDCDDQVCFDDNDVRANYKYIRIFDFQKPNTAMLSNFIDVNKI